MRQCSHYKLAAQIVKSNLRQGFLTLYVLSIMVVFQCDLQMQVDN